MICPFCGVKQIAGLLLIAVHNHHNPVLVIQSHLQGLSSFCFLQPQITLGQQGPKPICMAAGLPNLVIRRIQREPA